jgi:hypothetical protein
MFQSQFCANAWGAGLAHAALEWIGPQVDEFGHRNCRNGSAEELRGEFLASSGPLASLRKIK